MITIFEALERVRVIPVVTLERVEDAVPLARALITGGIRCMEVTFRTLVAAEAIAAIRQECADVLLGSGTVLTVEQAQQAQAAGAQFVVSPGFNPRVVAHCLGHGVPIIPGIASATEIERALEFGISVVKFFPAELLGGTAMMSALARPYTAVRFVPTGGIHLNNLAEYVAHPRVLACGGSWMVPAQSIAAGDFSQVTALSQQTLQIVGVM